ncbi:hypothetical protein [Pseudomonas sp. URIL14HWK12:I6]|jgi:hypothetical protein|uniref:hypothetical protein n=1 Tax=Pseudomonas sp. URIL14HWK12:I6 TaxID=1283293 RepID=UPI000480CAA6|nr:hypothetical protein [Pseudomonas sp. URIL14HWK12:I6]
MSYQLTTNGVLRLSDSAFVPQDPANRDWLEYQQWLASGGQVMTLNEALEESVPNNTLTTLAKKWLGGVVRQP